MAISLKIDSHGSLWCVGVLLLPLLGHFPTTSRGRAVVGHICLVTFPVLFGHFLERVLLPICHRLPTLGALHGEQLKVNFLVGVCPLVLVPTHLDKECVRSHLAC